LVKKQHRSLSFSSIAILYFILTIFYMMQTNNNRLDEWKIRKCEQLFMENELIEKIINNIKIEKQIMEFYSFWLKNFENVVGFSRVVAYYADPELNTVAEYFYFWLFFHRLNWVWFTKGFGWWKRINIDLGYWISIEKAEVEWKKYLIWWFSK
jgi:hypothetical protein